MCLLCALLSTSPCQAWTGPGQAQSDSPSSWLCQANEHSLEPALLAARTCCRARVLACLLLQVLSALPEACSTRHVALHPARRTQIVAALGASPIIAPLLELCMVGPRSGRSSPAVSHAGSVGLAAAGCVDAAGAQVQQPAQVPGGGSAQLQDAQQHFSMAVHLAGGGATGNGGSSSQACALPNVPLGLKLLHSWCELGHVPAGLEERSQVGLAPEGVCRHRTWRPCQMPCTTTVMITPRMQQMPTFL